MNEENSTTTPWPVYDEQTATTTSNTPSVWYS
jgi:hypothetical protein